MGIHTPWFLRMMDMTTAIQMPQDIGVNTQLGALVAHFNSSSKSVRKAFYKLISESSRKEAEMRLMKKIERGEMAIQNGQGISQMECESNEAFLERLCTQ